MEFLVTADNLAYAVLHELVVLVHEIEIILDERHSVKSDEKTPAAYNTLAGH